MKLSHLACALGLVACGSTPNRPLPATVPPPRDRAADTSVDPAASPAAPSADAPSKDASPAADPSPVAPPPEAAADRAEVRAETRDERGAPPDPSAADGRPRDVVARVAGRPVYAADLIDAWLHRASPEVRATLEELILSRLVLLEASRLEIDLAPETLADARRVVLGRLEEQVRRAGGGLDTAEFIRRRLGLDPATYMDRIARETTTDLLAERVVRAWVLASEHAEVRVIIVDERDDVAKVEQRLADGVPFAEVAEELSVEESAREGGRIPPVVRGDAALARLAFATPVGDVGGPVFEEDRWLFLRVDARPTPRVGTWREVGADVEKSLARRGIEDPEYWQWKADVLRRYEVDTTPLLELVGQPTGGQ